MYNLGRTMGWLACFLLLAALCAPLFAQQAPEGRIVGVVRDPSGAVVPGATIVVTNDGTNATYNVTSSAEGNFVVTSIPVGLYTVRISAKGFSVAAYNQVKVEPGKEYSLTAILQLGKASETVEVTAGQELVNTTSSEVSNTVISEQVQNLPLNGRDVVGLLSTQAGVGTSGRTATSINGTRPSWSQVTLDGINIQDIYIRTNALDYIPNRPTTDSVQEFTINNSGQGADAALGASGVRMVTPSGTNDYHGRLYEYNRNSAYDANDWFNNHVGIDKPFFNRNEFGGNLGGHIIKNKLFFYGYYEGIRLRQSTLLTQTIPMNDDYLQGVYRYYTPGDPNTVHSVNVMSLLGTAGLQNMNIDPQIQSLFIAKIAAAARANNSSAGDGVNTTGWSQSQRDNYNRDNYGFKIDYNPVEKHHFDFTYSHMSEFTERPDYDPVNVVPQVWNDSKPKLLTGAWRWTINNNLINNLRVGANLVNAPFTVGAQNTTGFHWGTSAGLTAPEVSFDPQGRTPKVTQYMDDANYVHGNHLFTFGGQYQQQRIYTYDAYGTIPWIYTGFTAAAPSDCEAGHAQLCTEDLTAAGVAAMSSTDLDNANALRAFLGGVISEAWQTFNVKSATSGFVSGAQQERHLAINDLSLYLQDKYRVKSNLTLTYGVKWEYFSPYKEQNGLQVGPLYNVPWDAKGSLMDPNGRVGFLKQAYRPDYHNIGPTVGFAWDPFKNGKTSFRGGYTLTFVNDDVFRFAGNAADGNAGLSSDVDMYPLYTTFNAGVPAVPTPSFQMPRTFADQLDLSSTNVVWALDPNMKMPMVHEINFGMERELPKDMAFSVRYVGTLGRDLLRGMDLNQNNAGTNEAFLADFNRARANGYLAQAAGLGFVPSYNPTVVGSQPLTILAGTMLGEYGGMLSNGSVQSFLKQNAAADLANFYVANRYYFPNAPTMFLANPGIYAVDYGTNGAFSSYHGGQAEVRRRYKNGLQFQANYTFAKLLTNSPTGGSGQTRFDPFLDNARPWLNKARADYDLRHAFKVNGMFDLPMGKGKALLSTADGTLNKIVGGWQLSSIFVWQSGNPFSITDTRGTFNRSGRSGIQSPVTDLRVDDIKKLFGFWEMPDGRLYYINPNVIDPATHRGVAPDSLNQAASTTFNQVFFNPVAGGIGNLRPLSFDGPSYVNLDLGLAKMTKITERVNAQFRIDAFNALNHKTFYMGDTNVTSTSFGQIQYTNTVNRQLQLSLRLSF